jgi:hypothetical protein
MRNLYTTSDVKAFSQAFGSIGMNRAQLAAIQNSAANENELEVIPIKTLNTSLVKMIDQLSVLDGYLKQKLDNQKIVDKNLQLSEREAELEKQVQPPEIIRQDAEKVDGSSMGGLGLLGLGAAGLLAFEPVREALSGLVSLAVDAGKFATNVLKSINGLFASLFSGTPDASVQQPAEGGVAPSSAGMASVGEGATSTDAQPVPPAPQEQRPGFIASTLTGAITGGAAGAVLPFVSARTGAVAGAAMGAYSYFTSPSAPSETSSPTTGGATTPVTTSPSSSTTGSSQEQATPAGEIPKNDIVALGNYLAGRGAEKSKMEHPALSGRVGDHSENSRHYRGMAIDVNFPGPGEAATLDALEPQLRAAGYNTIWRQKDHYTHMHVSVGGPEGGGSYGDTNNSSILGQAATAISNGIEETAKIIGAVAGVLVGKTSLKDLSTPLTDVSSIIRDSSVRENAAIASANIPKVPPRPSPPNINMSGTTSTIQNPPTMSDRNRLYYYIDRFNFTDVKKPFSPKTVMG